MYPSLCDWIFCPACVCFLFLATGCNRLRHELHETVYVSARQMYLHDRVAAVSNRVGEVVNGQPLEVLEHGRRFLRVKTEKNEIGWIEERAVIDSKTYDGFAHLGTEHKQDPVVATGTLRDDIYLHISPGRNTDRFYLLPENDKIQLLVRASVPKAAPGAPTGPAKRPVPRLRRLPNPRPKLPRYPAPKSRDVDTGGAPTSEPSEQAGRTRSSDGRLVADSRQPGPHRMVACGRVDVDVPDEVGQYAEGQRIVGAYVLTRVTDSEAQVPNHQVPEYVTALSPPKSGLPFDFDQIRVFTWSVKHHRYETAFRIHPIQGFLPVTRLDATRTERNRSRLQLSDFGFSRCRHRSDTGITKPVNPRTITYAMRDNRYAASVPTWLLFPHRICREKSQNPGRQQRRNTNNLIQAIGAGRRMTRA